MKFAIVRATPTAAMTTAGLLCDLDADTTMANVFQAMLAASEAPTDAELDDLCVAMWGNFLHWRLADSSNHPHHKMLQSKRKLDRSRMKQFLAALGDQP